MEAKQYKFTLINPYECSIEELEKEVKRLTILVEFYETKQLALKKFINSVYGATASKYFVAHNTLVAEAITLQGQDLNHFSENSVNDYFSGIFQEDTELHKILGISTEQAKTFDISKGKTTDTGPLTGRLFNYLKGTQSLTVAGDTDSVSGDSMITVNNKKMSIEDAYTLLLQLNDNKFKVIPNGSEIVDVNECTTLTYDPKTKEVVERPINYIMRHKVSKARYRITTESGKIVEVTEDHSCMVMRNDELISIKAKDINIETDKIVSIV